MNKILIVAFVVVLSIEAFAQDSTPAPTPRELELSSQLASCQSELAALKRPPVQQTDGAYLQTIEDLQQRIQDSAE